MSDKAERGTVRELRPASAESAVRRAAGGAAELRDPPVTVSAPSGAVAVPPERLLQDWKEAHDRAIAYLHALEVPPADHQALATAAVMRALAREEWETGDAVAETQRALRVLLPERYPPAHPLPPPGMDEFLAWRLDAALTNRFGTHTARLAGDDADGGARPVITAAPPVEPAAIDRRALGVVASPPLARGSMAPEPIERRFLHRMFRRVTGKPARASVAASLPDGGSLRAQRRQMPWTRVARRRRLLLAFLVLIPSVIASGFMVNVLPKHGATWLEVAIVFFFGALFGWISIGFWTALFGFFLLGTGRDRFAVTADAKDDRPIDPHVLTAIVMPIAQEPVHRVFSGLQAIHRSLQRAGVLDHFHFFILSDSGDASTWVREEEAWAEWCREVSGFNRIFYRHRRVRLRRKSGNVADFCRRWGRRYRYMVMLDADSIMTGESLAKLVRMMERRPDAGVIQTAPTAVERRSLFARVQQFATHVYGPMFAAGLHFWQLGDGQYWGHNAIIRLAPFMQHCALPRLPGKPPLGGEILSHDFVEAALMGRAGYTLWLAYDLGGSWEEVPSTLLEEMKRDRRWCQGNLQHLRLLFTEGLFGAHRALFLNGVMSYVSALLWFAFITLSTTEAIYNALREPDYFPHGASLFPEWPIWRPDWAMWLLGITGMILFLPKVLSIVLITVREHSTKLYGGVIKLSASVFLEILLSSILAPIRMVFHTRFVIMNLFGRTVTWKSQGRDDAETSWGEAIRHHGSDTLIATVWGITLYWLNPDYFWWVTPIIGGLILSIPASVLASRVTLGEKARAAGLFLVPEEVDPPIELRDSHELMRRYRQRAKHLPSVERDGFVRAAVDPYVNGVHRALLGPPRRLRDAIRGRREALVARAVDEGPGALGARERALVLSDPALVDELHRRVWEVPDHTRAQRWGRPGCIDLRV